VVIRIDDITQRLSLEEMMVQSEKCCLSVALPPAWPRSTTLWAIDPARAEHSSTPVPDLPKNLEQAEQVGVELSTVNDYLQAREVPQLLDGIQQPAPERQNRDPHAQFQSPQYPTNGPLRSAGADRSSRGNRR
jgi:hypothetical protein